MTYASKLDFNGPLVADKKKNGLGIERQDSIALRVEEYATSNGYNTLRVKEFAFDGMLTVVFVVAPENPLFVNPQLTCLKFTPLSKLKRFPPTEDVEEMSMDKFQKLSIAPKEQEKKMKKKQKQDGGFVAPKYDYVIAADGSRHRAGNVCKGVLSKLGRSDYQVQKAGNGARKCGFCFGKK